MKRVIIFTLWYYPSHFGMHVEDVRRAFEATGWRTHVVTVRPELYEHEYFAPVRPMFMDAPGADAGVTRLACTRFLPRASLSPLLTVDLAGAAELERAIRSGGWHFFHFFEHFAADFNRERYPGAVSVLLYYAVDFVRRHLAEYGAPITPGTARLVLDSTWAHLYGARPLRPRGVDFVTTETSSFAESARMAGCDLPVHVVSSPFDYAAVEATPRRDVRAELGIPLGAVVLLYAGRPTKNVRVLPRILGRVRAWLPGADVHLVLVGAQRFPLDGLEGDAEQRDRIHAIPPLSRPELFAYLKSADVFVNPSLVDAHPKCVAEARAAGVPVVSFDAPASAVREVLVSGRTGWLVPEGDEEAFAHAVAEVLTGPERRRAVVRLARRHVRMTQSLQAWARKFERVLAAEEARMREAGSRGTVVEAAET